MTTLQPHLPNFAPRDVFTRSGARVRTAVFGAAQSSKTRGVCVLLNGQTEFIEKYFEVIAELTARGFTVATMDWRGQGGSGRTLPDPLKVHIGDFSEYDDDLATLMDQVVRPLGQAKVIALAHSMGGHILLRTLHAKPDLVACAVLIAPMIAISTRGQPGWLARMVTAAMNLGGISPEWVWGMRERDPLKLTFDDQIVTSDRARFKRAQDALAANPDIRLAGPTWGWLEAAYRSMASMNAPGYAEAITTPTLTCGAGRDRICLTPQIKAFAQRMPNGRYVEFEDAEHEILMENDSIRARFWKAFDDFVAAFI